MRVHGYNDEKEIVGIDLPLHEIAISEIDPFRLDLFDPDPVVLKIAGKSVYFKRLGDIVFAYRGVGRQVLVGVHDGSSRACLVGDQLNERDVHLANARRTKLSFSENWQRYLYSFDYVRSGLAFIDIGIVQSSQVQQQPIPTDRVAVVGAPKPASSLRINGDKLTIGFETLAEWLHPVSFCGETFAERSM